MNYFVTGVTGNIGNEVVRRLLREENSYIWALMRADTEEELVQRKQRLFALWELSSAEVETYSQRFHAIRGDMILPRFGMSHKDWEGVVNSCEHVVHAAGVVKMNLPIEEARKYSVGSARNVIDLCDYVASNGGKVNLAFVSTVGVAGRASEPLSDGWVRKPRRFHNTYEQSKAEAEELLRRWDRESAVRLTVHRPSMAVGSSDGRLLHHQIFYYLCEFLSGRYTFGLQPRLRGVRLDTVPVEYVADAIVWAVKSTEPDIKIFNLCSGSGNEVDLLAVQKWTRQALFEVGRELPRIYELPLPVFTGSVRAAALISSASVRNRLKTLPVLIDYLKSPQVFEGKNSRNYLERKAGLSMPLPEHYLPKVIRKFYT